MQLYSLIAVAIVAIQGKEFDMENMENVEVPKSREAVYDEQISPLMAQVISIAKQHGISLIFSAQLDADEDGENPLHCSTWIPQADTSNALKDAAKVIYNGYIAIPKTYSFAITEKK